MVRVIISILQMEKLRPRQDSDLLRPMARIGVKPRPPVHCFVHYFSLMGPLVHRALDGNHVVPYGNLSFFFSFFQSGNMLICYSPFNTTCLCGAFLPRSSVCSAWYEFALLAPKFSKDVALSPNYRCELGVQS